MNFDYMPELGASIRVSGGEFRYGYFVVIALMALVCAGLYRAFKRSGWL
jgi:magnesium transporter